MEVVRRLRKERGWSQRELASAAGTTQYTISEIEQGHRDPHPKTLRKLADALGVSVADFFAEESAGPKGTAPLQPDLDDDAAGQEVEDSEDRLVMRQGYEQALASAHKKLRKDLSSLDTTDPQNSDELFALWTLASVSAMQAYTLAESEEFLQEGEGETVAERRALRGFLEAADSLSETADEITKLMESQGTRDAGIVRIEEVRRRRMTG